MSTLHPIRKRQRRSQLPSLHNRHILPLLAPKGRAYPETPVQHGLSLGHNNIQYQQPTGGLDPGNDINFQQSAVSQPGVPLKPVSPGHAFQSLERKQDSAVAPYLNTYSNRMPLTWADGFPELALGNPVSGAVTLENHGLSAHHLPHSNLQLQETIQNQQAQDCCLPTLHVPNDAVWAAMTQPNIGVHPPISTEPILAVQLAYHAPLPQNSQHVPCANCPSIWCFHLESITLSDPEGRGISNLRRSYRDLRQHIHEAHQGHYGSACAMCEDLFCFLLGNMVLLEAAGDFADIKVDLGGSFITLRQHIREAHGGC